MFNRYSGYGPDGRRTYELGDIGAVVGIASGLNNLFGGNSGGGNSNIPTAQQATTQAVAPWYQTNNGAGGAMAGSGAAAASTQLQSLIAGGPASVVNNPGFQQFNQQSVQALQRQLNATGQTMSGQEQTSLFNNTENNALTYYNSQVSQLGNLAGVGFNPASGTGVGVQAGIAQANASQGNWQAIAQGLGALSNQQQVQGKTGVLGYAATQPTGDLPGWGQQVSGPSASTNDMDWPSDPP